MKQILFNLLQTQSHLVIFHSGNRFQAKETRIQLGVRLIKTGRPDNDNNDCMENNDKKKFDCDKIYEDTGCFF